MLLMQQTWKKMFTCVWLKKNKHHLKAVKEPHGRQIHTLFTSFVPNYNTIRAKAWRERTIWVGLLFWHWLLPVSVSTILSQRKDYKLVSKSCHCRKWRREQQLFLAYHQASLILSSLCGTNSFLSLVALCCCGITAAPQMMNLPHFTVPFSTEQRTDSHQKHSTASDWQEET